MLAWFEVGRSPSFCSLSRAVEKKWIRSRFWNFLYSNPITWASGVEEFSQTVLNWKNCVHFLSLLHQTLPKNSYFGSDGRLHSFVPNYGIPCFALRRNCSPNTGIGVSVNVETRIEGDVQNSKRCGPEAIHSLYPCVGCWRRTVRTRTRTRRLQTPLFCNTKIDFLVQRGSVHRLWRR